MGRKDAEVIEAARLALAYINDHILAKAEQERLARAEMAFRMIRWLKTETLPSGTATLPGLVEFYLRDGGFLDWARNRLREMDISASLQKAFRQILDQVDSHFVRFEENFARKLAEWTEADQQSSLLVYIEDVLSKLIIPTAKDCPILLLVLDGMSVAVFRQLLRDFEQQDWVEIANDEIGVSRPVLATLPSLTQISRRALFTGKLSPARSGTEKGEFSDNDFLFHASGSQVRPKIIFEGGPARRRTWRNCSRS